MQELWRLNRQGVQGDKTTEPTTANYTFKHILEVQNTMYEIDLCPSQLKGVRLLALCLRPPPGCLSQALFPDGTPRCSVCNFRVCYNLILC